MQNASVPNQLADLSHIELHPKIIVPYTRPMRMLKQKTIQI